MIDCAETLLNHTDIDQAIQALLQTVLDFYQAERAYIYEIDHQTETLSNTYEVCVTPEKSQIQKGQNIPLSRWLDPSQSAPLMVLDSTAPAFSADGSEGTFLSHQGVACVLMSTLTEQDQTVGFLGVDNPKQERNDPTLLGKAANFVMDDFRRRGVAVELCNAVTDLQRSLDMSQITFDCAKILLNDTNTDVAIHSLLERVATYLGADRAYIFQHSQRETLLTNTHIYQEHKVRDPLNPGKTKLAEIALLQSTDTKNFFQNSYYYLRKGDKTPQPDSCQQQIFQSLGVDSCILAPFQKHGAFLGFLGVDHPRTNVDHKMLIATIAAFVVNSLEKRGMINQLESLSYSDELTGLKNRNAYLQKIKELRQKEPQRLGVVFADLNDLKSVNEMFGHHMGDSMILWCVKFLQGHVRDPIYRIGGDEFVCFIPGITQEKFEERVGAIRDVQQRMSYVNLSLGTVWAEKVEDLDDMIFSADKQMYQEKERIHAISKENIRNDQEKREQLDQRLKEIHRAD